MPSALHIKCPPAVIANGTHGLQAVLGADLTNGDGAFAKLGVSFFPQQLDIDVSAVGVEGCDVCNVFISVEAIYMKNEMVEGCFGHFR